MSDQQIMAYWGSPDDGNLHYETLDEAVAGILDEYPNASDPETIEVAGFVRRMPDSGLVAEIVLERLLEELDEEYGDPDGDGTPMSEKANAAANTFVDVVIGDYPVWQCDLVERRVINVAEWRAEKGGA